MAFDRIIVIDFETTGMSRDKRAVEIAWFELDFDLGIINEEQSLINPMIPIPREVTAIHGITDEMVENSPTLDRFILEMNQNTFASSNVCVIAHNLSFDLPLFQNYCGSVTELCTLKLSRALYPDWENHTLATVSQKIGVLSEHAHRARSDAMQVVHFLRMVRNDHDLDILQMVEVTGPSSKKSTIELNKPKSNRQDTSQSKNTINRSTKLVESKSELEDKVIAELLRIDSEADIQKEADATLTYDFTGWSTHQLAVLKLCLRRQKVSGTWVEDFYDVPDEDELLVDGIVADVMDQLENF